MRDLDNVFEILSEPTFCQTLQVFIHEAASYILRPCR